MNCPAYEKDCAGIKTNSLAQSLLDLVVNYR
jgi:hypothetical protein